MGWLLLRWTHEHDETFLEMRSKLEALMTYWQEGRSWGSRIQLYKISWCFGIGLFAIYFEIMQSDRRGGEGNKGNGLFGGFLFQFLFFLFFIFKRGEALYWVTFGNHELFHSLGIFFLLHLISCLDFVYFHSLNSINTWFHPSNSMNMDHWSVISDSKYWFVVLWLFYILFIH